MKNLRLILLGIAFVSLSLTAQEEIALVNGQFYNQNDELYVGKYKTYHDNKNIEAIYSLDHGVLNGEANFFYKDGSKQEVGFYSNGYKDGKWTKWSTSGKKVAEASYAHGEKDGKWLIWDENGTKRYELEYKKGDRIGVWKMWDENGKLISEKKY